MDTVVRPTGLRSYEHHDRKTTRMTHETPLVERVSYRDSDHSYSLDGKRIPSVTTLLGNLSKPALIYWAAKEGAAAVGEYLESVQHYDDDLHGPWAKITDGDIRHVMELARTAHTKRKNAAAAKGNRVHAAIDTFHRDYFNFELPDDGDPARIAVEAFLRWWTESGLRVVSVERKVVDAAGRYAGRLDLLCESDDALIVADTKTSGGIYPEHVLQNAAYAQAIESELDQEVDFTNVLWLPERATKLVVVERDRDEWKYDYKIFESLIDTHWHRKTLDKWLKGIKEDHGPTEEV